MIHIVYPTQCPQFVIFYLQLQCLALPAAGDSLIESYGVEIALQPIVSILAK